MQKARPVWLPAFWVTGLSGPFVRISTIGGRKIFKWISFSWPKICLRKMDSGLYSSGSTFCWIAATHSAKQKIPTPVIETNVICPLQWLHISVFTGSGDWVSEAAIHPTDLFICLILTFDSESFLGYIGFEIWNLGIVEPMWIQNKYKNWTTAWT